MPSCSLCNKPLDKNEDELTAKSGLKFHRPCLEQLVHGDSDTTYEPNDAIYTHSPSAKTRDASFGISTYENRLDEETWRCKHCSLDNSTSAKRCSSCGKQKDAPLIFRNESSDPENVEEQGDYTSSYNPYHQTRHYDHIKSSRKVAEDDEDDEDDDDDDRDDDNNNDYIRKSVISKSDHQRQSSKGKKLEQEHKDDMYAIHMPRSHDDQSPPSHAKKTSLKKIKAREVFSPPSTSYSRHENVVYIPDLPSDMIDNLELDQLIRRRTDIFGIKLIDVKCYSKLGIGVIQVADTERRDRLLKMGKLALDPKDGQYFITFVDTIELVSYIVLDVPEIRKDDALPTTEEITRRWIDLHKGDKPLSCDILHIQFPNIYRIVSTSLDKLVSAPDNDVFKIKVFLARIYYCADCSFFEDLPHSVTQDQLREAIATAIGQKDISTTSLHIEINKKTDTACIIAADTARVWSTKSYISIDKNTTLTKKTTLSCRIRIHPIPPTISIQSIINHPELNGKVTNHKQTGDHLILELSDKDVFKRCLERGALRINNQHVVNVDLCNTPNRKDDEFDTDTWYETDMLQYESDIMQFVVNPQHPIFQYKWNPQIWLQQFKHVDEEKRDSNRKTAYDRKNSTPDHRRHQLRVTVMLNTLAAIQKKRYMIGDQEFKLNLKNELKTIVYDHQSKLERPEKMPLTKTPYSQTTVQVVQEDCLIAYERMVKSGKRPLLLNMASATTPGGGYRKGDGAQEENLFRRSDYCRSLDIGLDDFFQQRPKRLHCSSNCQLEPIYAQNNIYPMDEYGAIYTSDITVFRQPEETGYAYMENSLEDVCAIAMAAYRDPDLKGGMLAPKYAVGTRKKIENIFAVAYHHKHDSIVLSALGCGAFKNPPDHIVKIFQSVIEQYAGFFKLIVFAIVDDHNTGHHLNPKGNFQPFVKLDGLIVQPSTTMGKPNTMFGPYRFLSNGSSVSDVSIFDLTPCKYGAKCSEIYTPNHASQFSHPSLCIQAAVNDKCKLTNDPVHMISFIHRTPCRNGGECQQINDEKHNQEYEHPDYCPDGDKCQNQKEDHLKHYRHLPLCEKSHRCMDYQKQIPEHCNKYRHCAPVCPYGNYCAMFHDKKHLDEFQHPFPTPCQFTPFDCPHYIALTESKNIRTLSMKIQQHCLDFAHVCIYGRNCTDKTSLHWSKSIHIARHICPYHDKCNKLNDEEHLNLFTHSKIPDIRPPCQHADKCRDRRKVEHKAEFRHPMFHETGVVQYCGLNENTDFVRNQTKNTEHIEEYIRRQKWKPLPSGSIPREIINWLRTVQPIHRCTPIIFESILLHGHVMGREYMDRLKDPTFVANSVLQHSRIRRIKALKLKTYEDDTRLYIIAVVSLVFEKTGFFAAIAAPPTLSGSDAPPREISHSSIAYYANIIKKKENKLSGIIHANDMDALREKAVEVALASIKLHLDPAGIGHPPDKALGTNKFVFSILGPHLGHYYGDVVIIFKREILHHPDANFSMQAATSFASGNAYKSRPWLGDDPGSIEERVKDYHKTKLHASVPGYDYAAALELMAFTSHYSKLKRMDIDLQEILDQWVKIDSHLNIEAHLPQLIPLDYIDHIYIPKNLFDKLSDRAHEEIDTVFAHRITVVPHDGDDKPGGSFGPTPTMKSRVEYQNFVVKKLRDRYKHNMDHLLSRSIKDFMITIPSTGFNDHYVLPLTLSQAYTQYRSEHSHPSKDNITYIYWKAMNGDMMLTLSNAEIDQNEKQRNLRCLICYVAPKSTSNDNHYYEHTSYLSSGHPFQHQMIIAEKKYRAKSNTFYTGCNTSDFITYCLEIHRSSGKAILSHAGSNAIYNHEEISCTFSRSELDLSKLEFIHVSAGAHTVPIRNLMICFEKQPDLHPTFDKNFKKDDSDGTKNRTSTDTTTDDRISRHGAQRSSSSESNDDSTSWKPCRNNINCLIQYSDNKVKHNSKFSHPCRYAELCKNKETHLTHETHSASKCDYDKKCKKLDDPFHRASYRHTGLPDFLTPCRDQNKCQDKSSTHRMEYSHGEQIFAEVPSIAPATATNQRTPCKWGAQCNNKDADHRAKHSHRSHAKPQKQNEDHKTDCNRGRECQNHDSDHRAKFFHPKK